MGIEPGALVVEIGTPRALGPSDFDSSLLARALRARTPAIRRAYEGAWASSEEPEGHITIQLTVERSGALSHVLVSEDFEGATELGLAIVEAIRSVRLPSGPARRAIYEVPIVLAAR